MRIESGVQQISTAKHANRPIRVLHANKQYAPWIGGVEVVVQEICEYMNQSSEIWCEVLVCHHKGRQSKDELNRVPVTRVSSLGTALSMPLAPTYPRELQARATDYDIVHVHVPFPAAFLCDWRRVKKHGTRVVIHYHSDVVRPLQRMLLKPLSKLQQRLFDAADRIIVTSNGLLNTSLVLQPFQEKCRVVPLSIDLEKVGTPPMHEVQAVRAKFGIGNQRPIVLSVARLVYYKGIQFLIEAVRTLEVTVVVAGEGPLAEVLRKQIHNAGLDNRVLLVGRVSDQELSCLYRMADLFVLPSIEPSEAFGIVQLEAMARGLPVINTNLRGGVPSVSLHGITGLTVSPRSSDELRDAIEKIAFDRDLHDQLSSAAKVRVQNFSREAVLHEISTIYRELVL